MYKSRIVLALLLSSVSLAASAADVGGLPLGGLAKGEEPKTTDVDGVPLIEDSSKPKLKSVKDLFKSSKDSAPKAPDVISDKPEIVDVDSVDTKPAKTVPFPEPEKAKTQAPATETPSAEAPISAENIVDLNAEPKENDNESKVDTSAEGTSIMFDQTNIYQVMRVLSAYIESQSNKIDPVTFEQSKKSLEDIQKELLTKLNPENFVKGKKDIVTVRLPAYVRVDSLIFRSASNKKVWVNSRPFVEGDNSGEVSVKAIQPEWAYIELSAKDTNIGLEKFDKLLKKRKNPNGVKIDLVKQTISFRLSVNQYIDLVSLKIKEGDFTGSFNNRFYDPMKPEDRFVPLEEAEKTAEAEAVAPDAKLEEISPVEAIDSEEIPAAKEAAKPEAPTKPEEKTEQKPGEAEKTIIETSPEKK